MENIYQSVLEDICEKLDCEGFVGCYGSDLHHYLCNQDYFIIGSYSAKRFLGDHAFEAIEMVKIYEQENFGEVTTDLSQPELVVNMVSYIAGEHILSASDHLQEAWDKRLTSEDFQAILSDLQTISAANLCHKAAA